MASLMRGGGRHHCNLVQQEGPRSFASQHHLQDQECCQVIGEGEVSTEEEKVSARRGLRMMEERDSWGESRVPPEGVNFFPKENLCKLLFAPNFTFTFISESEIGPCTFCLCIVCNSI